MGDRTPGSWPDRSQILNSGRTGTKDAFLNSRHPVPRAPRAGVETCARRPSESQTAALSRTARPDPPSPTAGTGGLRKVYADAGLGFGGASRQVRHRSDVTGSELVARTA